MTPDLSIIIVSYNTSDLLQRCLRSITGLRERSVEIIVVDNASGDGSAEMVADRFPQVRLIKNEGNLGFSRANNRALTECSGRYVLFLNPDTTVKEQSIDSALAYMQRHPEIGLAGLRLANPDGSPQQSVEDRYPGHRHAGKELSGLCGDIAWVMGAAMIAPAGVIAETNGFDEDFFLYGEDMDLCLRIRKAGYPIGFISEAEVTHWGGASEAGTSNIRLLEKKFNAELLFYEKHYAPSTVRAIRKNNITKALWRILVLTPQMLWSEKNSTAAHKLARYRLALSVYSGKKAAIGSTRPI